MKDEIVETAAAKYVKSLRDAVKRRFAANYLEWILAGRAGASPVRGLLPPALAHAVMLNLAALA